MSHALAQKPFPIYIHLSRILSHTRSTFFTGGPEERGCDEIARESQPGGPEERGCDEIARESQPTRAHLHAQGGEDAQRELDHVARDARL